MSKTRVIHCLGKLNAGGAETLVINILRNIDKEKFQFDFLLFDETPGFYDKEVKKYGCNLFYLPSVSKAGVRQYINNMIYFFKKEKVTIVHSHMDWLGGFIAFAAYKAGVKKIIVHSHANQKMFDSNIQHHILINISKYLIKRYATNCVACSIEAGESLFNKKFEVLFNGIDLERFQNINRNVVENLKEEFNIEPNDIILGNVGSLSKNKNQIFLIEILNELLKTNNNYKLLLVGEGSQKKDLKEYVTKLGLNDAVIFAGVRSEVPEILSLFQIFLFPSIYEGLGIVAIEAQVGGIPCIISTGVPKEVDIGLELTYFIDLNKKKWIEQAKKLENYKFEGNFKNLISSKYNIKNTCEQLIKIYERGREK